MPDPKGKPMPAMTFNHIAPVMMQVNNVAIELMEDSLQAQPHAPFIKPLPVVAENYFASKVTPAMNNSAVDLAGRSFTVQIHEASVAHNYVPAGREMARFLGVGGLDEYVLNVAVLLLLETPELKKTVKMSAGRTIRVNEHSSIADRERNQLVALEELLKTLDTEVERVIRAEYSDYVMN